MKSRKNRKFQKPTIKQKQKKIRKEEEKIILKANLHQSFLEEPNLT